MVVGNDALHVFRRKAAQEFVHIFVRRTGFAKMKDLKSGVEQGSDRSGFIFKEFRLGNHYQFHTIRVYFFCHLY